MGHADIAVRKVMLSELAEADPRQHSNLKIRGPLPIQGSKVGELTTWRMSNRMMAMNRSTRNMLYILCLRRKQPMIITVFVNGAEDYMELNTEASISVLSQVTYNNLWSAQEAPEIVSLMSNSLPILGKGYQLQELSTSKLCTKIRRRKLNSWLCKTVV